MVSTCAMCGTLNTVCSTNHYQHQHLVQMNTKQELLTMVSTYAMCTYSPPIMLCQDPQYCLLHQALYTCILLAACYRRVLCFKQEDRLETEGTPVPVSLLSACILGLHLCPHIPPFRHDPPHSLHAGQPACVSQSLQD